MTESVITESQKGLVKELIRLFKELTPENAEDSKARSIDVGDALSDAGLPFEILVKAVGTLIHPELIRGKDDDERARLLALTKEPIVLELREALTEEVKEILLPSRSS